MRSPNSTQHRWSRRAVVLAFVSALALSAFGSGSGAVATSLHQRLSTDSAWSGIEAPSASCNSIGQLLSPA